MGLPSSTATVVIVVHRTFLYVRKCPRPLSRPTTSRSTLVAQPGWSNLRSPLWDTEGASQNTLIDSEFLCGSVSKIWSLFRSTRAATIMVRTEKIMPMPILGRMSMPLTFPLALLKRGTRILSYIEMETIIPMVTRPYTEAGGIIKWRVILRFRVVLCLIKNVAACATHTPNGRVVSQVGNWDHVDYKLHLFHLCHSC